MANNERFEEGKAAARNIKETIKDGARQVGSDMRQTASDARDATADTFAVARDATPTVVDGAKETIDDLRIEAQDAMGDLYDDTVMAIRKRPVASVLIVGLAGAVLALLARRALS